MLLPVTRRSWLKRVRRQGRHVNKEVLMYQTSIHTPNPTTMAKPYSTVLRLSLGAGRSRERALSCIMSRACRCD